ncbi:MAG: hypothetical protein MMC33_000326 [Icmadophila ericetorum]|nr:hypothetical protein [Icmadophila ericetorum]
MSTAKFTGSRGIVPLATMLVRVPGWTLALNIAGLPYSEPVFASIMPTSKRDAEGRKVFRLVKEEEEEKDVFGIGYLVTPNQYIHIIGSEGGGIAYRDVEVEAVPIGSGNVEQTGACERIRMRTLGAAMERCPGGRPSERYMGIVKEGAREAQLPKEYQSLLDEISVYEPPRQRWQKLGASIFLAIWGPIMGVMENIIVATLGDDGHCPNIIIWLVRLIVTLMWWSHDVLFAPVFGRGDGLDCEGRGDGRTKRSEALVKNLVDDLSFFV